MFYFIVNKFTLEKHRLCKFIKLHIGTLNLSMTKKCNFSGLLVSISCLSNDREANLFKANDKLKCVRVILKVEFCK